MRGGNPLDSNLKIEFPVFFCRADSKKDIKSTITVCRFDEKNNERGADGKQKMGQVASLPLKWFGYRSLHHILGKSTQSLKENGNRTRR
jgi:hypothetical protein